MLSGTARSVRLNSAGSKAATSSRTTGGSPPRYSRCNPEAIVEVHDRLIGETEIGEGSSERRDAFGLGRERPRRRERRLIPDRSPPQEWRRRHRSASRLRLPPDGTGRPAFATSSSGGLHR